MRKLLPVNLSTISFLSPYNSLAVLFMVFCLGSCSKKQEQKISPELKVSIQSGQNTFAPTDTFTITIEYKNAQEVSLTLTNTCGETTSSTILPSENSGVWEPSFSVSDLEWEKLNVNYSVKAKGESTSSSSDSIFISAQPVLTEIWAVYDNSTVERITPNGNFINNEEHIFSPFFISPSKPVTQIGLNENQARIEHCSVKEVTTPPYSFVDIVKSNNKLLWVSQEDDIWVTTTNGTPLQEWQLNGLIPQKLISLKNHYYLLYTLANEDKVGLAIYDKQFNQLENTYPTPILGVAKMEEEKIILIEPFNETQSISRVFDTRLQNFNQQQTFLTVDFKDVILYQNQLIFEEDDQLSSLTLFTSSAQPNVIFNGTVSQLKKEPITGDLFWLTDQNLIQKKGADQNSIYSFQAAPKRLLFQYEVR